jgi:hypothetical protein
MKPLSFLFPLAAAAAPTPPTPPTPPAPAADSPSGSHWSFKNGASESEIEIQTTGNVTFDPSSEALYDLHGDGTLRVSERAGKDQRVLTAQRDAVEWRVNGAVRLFDAHGKRWLRAILKARPRTPTPPTPPPPRK